MSSGFSPSIISLDARTDPARRNGCRRRGALIEALKKYRDSKQTRGRHHVIYWW